MCTNCHGADGTAPIARGRTAGQSKDYLVNALKAYKGGVENVIMSALAKGLSDADTENLAAYYASASCK